MDKLKVYVHSLEIPTTGFVDKEGAMHACAQAQKSAFERLSNVSSLLGDRYLTDDEREVLTKAVDFCRMNSVEYEVVDLGTMPFLDRLSLKLKGLKTPAVSCADTVFRGFPDEETLKRILNLT